MSLTLQQNQSTLTGTCTINNVPYAVQNGVVNMSSVVHFSITDNTSGTNFVVNFAGTQQSNGSLSGNYTASDGGNGTWAVAKQ